MPTVTVAPGQSLAIPEGTHSITITNPGPGTGQCNVDHQNITINPQQTKTINLIGDATTLDNVGKTTLTVTY